MNNINRYIPKPVNDFLQSGKHVHIKWNKDLSTELFQLDTEGLTIACDTILRIAGTRETDVNNFVEIQSDNFHKILHHDYKLYLDYLIDSKIILTDNQYIVGEKSTSYKINEDYIDDLDLQTIKIDNKLFNKRTLKAIASTDSKLKPTLKHKNNYLKSFKIDYEGASRYMVECYIQGSKDHKGRILNKYTKNILQHKLLQIKNGELWINRSATNGRINSNLSSLNSDYKQFILGYDFSLDITSSQPLLVNVLVNQIKDLQNGATEPTASLSTILLSLLSYECKTLSKSFSKTDVARLTKELKIIKLPNQKEIEDWKNLCQRGRLYEYFQEIINEKMNTKITRTEAKQIVITTMYSNATLNNEYKKMFNATFPSMYKFLSDIKKILKVKRSHRLLPLILQSIESFVWCENILPQLDMMNIPYLFIHDSVIVKEKDLDRTDLKIQEVYFKFGVNVNIKKEKLRK